MRNRDTTLSGVALVADGDPERGKGLAEACSTIGLSTRFVTHGAEALEAALAEPPDVVVAALGLPLIDAPQLAGILRANPRTQGARFIVVGGDPGDPIGHAAIDARVPDPVDPEAVLRRVERLLLQEPPSGGESGRPGGEIGLEGRLAQLALADLLQIFHMNRKTGRIELLQRAADGADEGGLVAVVDGNVVDARCGGVGGEKALHRLLAWRTGRFLFRPTAVAGPARIHTPTRALLLEGMRQLDEMARLRTELPPPDAELAFRASAPDLPPTLSPLTREVLSLVSTFPRVGDVVDRSRHPDYQVLRTLQALVERGFLELRGRTTASAASVPGTLFSASQLGRLRDWTHRRHGGAAPFRDARLLLASTDPAATRELLSLLARLPAVHIDRAFRNGQFSGSTLRRIGRMGPDEEVGIEMLHLPVHSSCEPLWALAASSALGLLCLASDPHAEGARRLKELRRQIEQDAGLRSFTVVLDHRAERLSSRATASSLGLRGGTAPFRLRPGDESQVRECLSQLLASLVP